MVTKSANDVAVVVAENLGGSEETSPSMMTRKARALGMSQTVYRNASGLPDPEQITTARDLTVLARAIQDRFPKYYRYFQTRVFNYAGRSHRNHNTLLGRVEGVDGIKTGFTRASGFNLLTSVSTDDRHIVAVVLGGRSGARRDRTMAALVADQSAPRLCRRPHRAGDRRAASDRPAPGGRRRRGRPEAAAADAAGRRAATGAVPRSGEPQAPRPRRAAAGRRLRGRRKLDDDAHVPPALAAAARSRSRPHAQAYAPAPTPAAGACTPSAAPLVEPAPAASPRRRSSASAEMTAEPEPPQDPKSSPRSSPPQPKREDRLRPRRDRQPG